MEKRIAPSRRPTDLKSIHLRRVPFELHRKFKALCATNEVGMQDAVISLIQKAVSGEVKFWKPKKENS